MSQHAIYNFGQNVVIANCPSIYRVISWENPEIVD